MDGMGGHWRFTRRWLLTVGAIGCASVMAACQSKPTTPTTTAAHNNSSSVASIPATKAAPASTGPVTITVWKFGGTNQENAWMQKRTDAFSKANPSSPVKWEYFYGQIRRNKMIGAFQTKKLPDVSIGFGQDIPDFSGLNIISALTDIDNTTASGWAKNLIPEIYDTGKYNGKLWGLATYVDAATFLAYNTDILKKAGYVDGNGNAKPPSSWSELRAYAKKLTTSDHVGFIFQASLVPVDVNILEGIAYSNGGIWLKDLKVEINQPGFVDALQLYVDLVGDKSTPPAATIVQNSFSDSGKVFFTGKAAMWAGMSWLAAIAVGDLGNKAKEFPYQGTIFPRPDKVTGQNPTAAMLMDPTACLMICSTSAAKEQSMAYLNFWNQKEQLIAWDGSIIQGRIPALKAAWETTSFKQTYPDWYAHRNDMFKGAEPLPRFLGLADSETKLSTAVQQAILGQNSTQQALDEAAKAAQQLVDTMNK